MTEVASIPGSSALVADLTLKDGLVHALTEDDKQIIYDLARRVASIAQAQARLRQWCDRADRLYYAEDMTSGGADLWAEDPSARTRGRSHVSVNLPGMYVDVPAALQAVEPIENMLATDTTKAAREDAAAQERVYTAWKQAEGFDLKFHKSCTIKSLYGITAGRVFWNTAVNPKRPSVEIIEQPRNLHLGYKTDNYDEIEWAAYLLLYEPNAVVEQFGVDVTPFKKDDGTYIPLVQQRAFESSPTRPWLSLGDARIEVWDYWYRKPVWRGTTFVRMDTYNVVIAGNMVVRGPDKHDELGGEVPYLPLYNTFVPGLPWGRPDLYDVEPLLREKMEVVTAGSQMIHNAVAGDYWQLVGTDAPSSVKQGFKPVRNEVIAPGAGNRIEAITPFVAAVQWEQYLVRIDRDLAQVSGINDLLAGLAPAQVLSSSKAINALIANYESRLSMRRQLLYTWRRKVWDFTLRIWQKKATGDIKRTLNSANPGFLDIVDPSLSPRDEMETSTRAANLVNAKLISQARGMDMVGVDDPETEQQMIREESTDATLWPDRVQVMAQLLSVLNTLGLQAPAGATAQAQGQMTSGQSDLRNALGLATPTNMPGAGGAGGAPESMGQTPPIAGAPPSAGGPPSPFQQGPGNGSQLQTILSNGQSKGRIKTQQQLGVRGG